MKRAAHTNPDILCNMSLFFMKDGTKVPFAHTLIDGYHV